MKLINKTPHRITVLTIDNEVITEIEPDGDSIRLDESATFTGMIDVEDIRVHVYRVKYGSSDLPPVEEGTAYIVSAKVCDAFPDRKDFLFPYDMTRNNEGKILGCKSFANNFNSNAP